MKIERKRTTIHDLKCSCGSEELEIEIAPELHSSGQRSYYSAIGNITCGVCGKHLLSIGATDCD